MTTWIFQGNPQTFKVDEYLRTRRSITWTVRQECYRDRISPGDVVYIWRSDGSKSRSGGIVAKGRIMTRPTIMEDDAPELWTKSDESPKALRVRIELDEVRLTEREGMLRRVDLERNEMLEEMRILRLRNETNYRLESEHAELIYDLWQQNRVP